MLQTLSAAYWPVKWIFKFIFRSTLSALILYFASNGYTMSNTLTTGYDDVLIPNAIHPRYQQQHQQQRKLKSLTNHRCCSCTNRTVTSPRALPQPRPRPCSHLGSWQHLGASQHPLLVWHHKTYMWTSHGIETSGSVGYLPGSARVFISLLAFHRFCETLNDTL